MDLAAVAHVDDDVASRCEPRQEAPGRVDQHEEFARGTHVPDARDFHRHNLAFVQPQLLVGHAGEFLRRRGLLGDAVIRRRDFHRPPFQDHR